MQLLTRGDESFRWCCEEGREFSGFIVRRFHARWGEMADYQSLLSPVFLSFENLPVLPPRFPVLRSSYF